MIEGLAAASPLYIPVERQSNPLLNEEQSASSVIHHSMLVLKLLKRRLKC